jgi:hypothetical protein
VSGIMASAGARRSLRCAVWWPQAASLPLSNLDLVLLGPGGAQVAASALPASVWEKVSLTEDAVKSGEYKLQIKAVTLAGTWQLVHAFCFA